jgi:hypothetical protein
MSERFLSDALSKELPISKMTNLTTIYSLRTVAWASMVSD